MRVRRRPVRDRNPLANPIEVAAGLVFHQGRLLLTQRPPHAHLGGLWEFPGGKREAGESFEECLRRELREELAIEVEVGALVDEVCHAYAEKTVRLKFFRCRWIQGGLQKIGCHAFAWVERRALDDYEFPDADARILTELREREDLWGGPPR